jgi:hypothetical protein
MAIIVFQGDFEGSVVTDSYSGGRDQNDLGTKPGRQIIPETLSQKCPTQKWAGGVPQVVECLPSKCETLGTNSSAAKIKKKRKEKNSLSISQ